MERVTISLDEELLAKFDGFIAQKGYENRSEAIRDLLRERMEASGEVSGKEPKHAVGCLSYVYNHHQRQLPQRLTQAQHDHHDFVLTTLHVHLDHDNCLEVILLRGPTRELRAFAESTIAETGIRHGQLHLVGTDIVRGGHKHSHGKDAAPHVHAHPRT
jgi:CopG family nickel-responsive transcriptional regulator